MISVARRVVTDAHAAKLMAAIVAAALLSAGCNADNGSQNPPSKPACDFIPTAAVQTIYGNPLEAGAPVNGPFVDCRWIAASQSPYPQGEPSPPNDDTVVPSDGVEVVFSDDSFDRLERETADPSKAISIDGVGDEAIAEFTSYGNGDGYWTAYVKKGRFEFWISSSRLVDGSPFSRENTIVLARTMADHL